MVGSNPHPRPAAHPLRLEAAPQQSMSGTCTTHLRCTTWAQCSTTRKDRRAWRAARKATYVQQHPLRSGCSTARTEGGAANLAPASRTATMMLTLNQRAKARRQGDASAKGSAAEQSARRALGCPQVSRRRLGGRLIVAQQWSWLSSPQPLLLLLLLLLLLRMQTPPRLRCPARCTVLRRARAAPARSGSRTRPG